LADGRIVLALGDVSGKGLGPALVMAGLRTLVRCRLPPRSDDLAGVMSELNEDLLMSTPEEMFVTPFLALLEPSTARLRYVNAGHPAALVLTEPGGTVRARLATGGTILGVLPEASFEERVEELPRGSLLAVFSDGITEAENKAGDRFGEQRLRTVLR